MATALPYYPMYPKDFDTDEDIRLMTRAEKGMFLDLLNHSWLNDGIPTESEQVRRLLKDDPSDFSRDWPAVEKCFPVHEDGRRRNPRQEVERVKASKKSSAARTNVLRRHNGGKTTVEPQYNDSCTRASGSDSVSEESKKIKTSLPAVDEQYREYAQLMCDHATAIPEDFLPGTFTHRFWYAKDYEERKQIVQSVKDRVAAGVQIKHKPENYISTNQHKRPIRAPTPIREESTIQAMIREAKERNLQA